jgi:hypothetical protein
MRFFFPDSQDFVDPSFDMWTETRARHRVRQRDDLYAHEIFPVPPFDGVLVSMAIVMGFGAGTGKYSLAQRSRFMRQGVREFLRIPEDSRLETFGDCGAFSYVREHRPPFGASEAFDFYEQAGFDYGLSVDHVIPAYKPELDETLALPGLGAEIERWRERQEISLQLASEFMDLCRNRRHRFEPVGVAQGWSPVSCAMAVTNLQRMGYTQIAIGGLVPLKTHEILAVLGEVAGVRASNVSLHLLGITRLEAIQKFRGFGVTSFDSTAPLMRAFKDKSKNYFIGHRTFPAIRIPQLNGNPKLKRRVLSGEVDPEKARVLERQVLDLVRDFTKDRVGVDDLLSAVLRYEALFDPTSDREADYRQVLTERPWERCGCAICREIGIHVILFRGAERNRRRGFHNLYQFRQSLFETLAESSTPSAERIRRVQ